MDRPARLPDLAGPEADKTSPNNVPTSDREPMNRQARGDRARIGRKPNAALARNMATANDQARRKASSWRQRRQAMREPKRPAMDRVTTAKDEALGHVPGVSGREFSGCQIRPRRVSARP